MSPVRERRDLLMSPEREREIYIYNMREKYLLMSPERKRKILLCLLTLGITKSKPQRKRKRERKFTHPLICTTSGS